MDSVSIPKRVSEALKLASDVAKLVDIRQVSIPKRVSEALKLYRAKRCILCLEYSVSIPKRVSEALKLRRSL